MMSRSRAPLDGRLRIFVSGAVGVVFMELRESWQESMTMGLMCRCQIALLVVVGKLVWPGGAMKS